MKPTRTKTKISNAAQTALEHARRSRRVVIVTRTAFHANQALDEIMLAYVTTAPADGGMPLRMSRANGRWHVGSIAWLGGSIDVRLAVSGLHGMTADTVLIASDVSRSVYRAAHPVVATSRAPMVGAW